MHCDGSILPKLLLGLVHLPDEIDEPLARLGDTLLWPVCELELSNCPRLPILGEANRGGWMTKFVALPRPGDTVTIASTYTVIGPKGTLRDVFVAPTPFTPKFLPHEQAVMSCVLR